MFNRQDAINAALRALNSAGSEPQRAAASTRLVELGAIYNGTTPNGITYVEPAPWVRALESGS